MSATAKICPGQAAGTDSIDPFASLWSVPVPALKPLCAARVIHSWEGPTDLWSPATPPKAELAGELARASEERVSVPPRGAAASCATSSQPVLRRLLSRMLGKH